MLKDIEGIVDEPQANDDISPSADIYYSWPSTSNRIIITKISSQISDLLMYFEEDDLSLELETWDTLSDEALANFEVILD